jgi:aspartate 1-decarboxylase
VCLNGATARKVQVGDILIIMSYGSLPIEEAKLYHPILVFPDDNNRLLK